MTGGQSNGITASGNDDASRRWLLPAIVLSAIASGVHVLAAPEHFEEWVGYGLFFVAAAAAQGVYAVLLLYLGPRRWLLLAGIIGNALIVGLWLVTRTVGIPWFGPEAGTVEPIGLLDSISKIAEVALIVCLVRLAQDTRMDASLQTR
jgi:hypothetical protein